MKSKEGKMKSKEGCVFVGLDVHQDSIQLCIVNSEGQSLFNRRLANEVAPLISTIRRFGTEPRIGLEACSGTAALADELIQATGWPVQLTHAGYAHRMRQNPDKSDCSDAYLLADLVRVGYLPRVWLEGRGHTARFVAGPGFIGPRTARL